MPKAEIGASNQRAGVEVETGDRGKAPRERMREGKVTQKNKFCFWGSACHGIRRGKAYLPS